MKKSIVTSAKAKDHLFKAHTAMNDMKQSMMMQKAKVDVNNKEKQGKLEEQKRFDETNVHKQALERVKKLL